MYLNVLVLITTRVWCTNKCHPSSYIYL